MDEDIQIVRKVVTSGKVFYRQGAYGVADSLEACNDAGYQTLFMPELTMARADADKDPRFWQTWFLTPSVRVTGRSRNGNPVVVYAHVPTSLSNPANIRKIIDEKALVNGAGSMPQDEFYGLLNQEGNGRVFVVNYDNLKGSTSGVINVDDALAHPQTIPFLGGEQNAQVYLAKHKDVYGKRIGVWHSDDLNDSPMGRVLYLGDDYDYGLDGYIILDYGGRVLGVAPEAQVAQNFSRIQIPLEARVEVLDGGTIKYLGRTYVLVEANGSVQGSQSDTREPVGLERFRKLEVD